MIYFSKNAKKTGPPRRAAAAQPEQSRCPPQKTFGPPILSAIPVDQNESEVNLKRQTFVPIHATMPQTQLPVITTPKQPAAGTVSFFNFVLKIHKLRILSKVQT